MVGKFPVANTRHRKQEFLEISLAYFSKAEFLQPFQMSRGGGKSESTRNTAILLFQL